MESALLILGTAVFVAAAMLSRRFSAEAIARRRIARVKATPIADAKSGDLVKIVGRLRVAGSPVVAPLTGRRCACWEALVEEEDRSVWQPVAAEARTSDFVIEDGTGRAFVPAGDHALAVIKDHQASSGFRQPATEEMEAFLARHGETSRGLVFHRALRWREGVLEAGEEVAVFGVARWEPDPDPSAAHGFRELAQRLVLVAPQDGRILISDAVAATLRDGNPYVTA